MKVYIEHEGINSLSEDYFYGQAYTSYYSKTYGRK